jgi:hypothetical protein
MIPPNPIFTRTATASPHAQTEPATPHAQTEPATPHARTEPANGEQPDRASQPRAGPSQPAGSNPTEPAPARSDGTGHPGVPRAGRTA